MPALPWTRQFSLALSLLVALAACGGDSASPNPPPAPPPPPPPPPPAPVVSVGVDPGTATLALQETRQLTATARDAQGNPLTGRSITWTTNAQAVATVSTSGLVAAVSAGNATITATSEGKSGTATITVAPGVVVGPQGGNFTFDGGAIKVTVPAGAVSAPIVLSAIAAGPPSDPAPDGWQVSGPVYLLSPEGTTFAQPVTVTLTYDNEKLPGFVMTGDLAVRQLAGAQWVSLPNPAVDDGTQTIAVQMSSFPAGVAGPAASGGVQPTGGTGTPVALMVQDPDVQITPGQGSISASHRYANFSVTLTPRGGGIFLPATGVSDPPLFRWRSSTNRGELIDAQALGAWGTTTGAQYFSADANLAQLSGEIDRVQVDVLLNPESLTDPLIPPRIITAEAVVDADLKLSFRITPVRDTIAKGDDTEFRMVVRDDQGTVVPLGNDKVVEWESSENHGTLEAGYDETTGRITYTAEAAPAFPPPRVDRIVGVAIQLSTQQNSQARFGIWNAQGYTMSTVNTPIRTEVGRDTAFVLVKTEYAITLTPSATTVGLGGTVTLTTTLDPAFEGPADAAPTFRYTSAETQGTLTPASGTMVTLPTASFKADDLAPGGNETIKVEVFDQDGESIGEAEVTIDVDPWRSGSFNVYFMQANCQAPFLVIPKVAGATQYEVLADGFDHPDLGTQYTQTFSGPTGGTGVFSVVDLGNSYRIRMEGGGCAVSQSAQDAMRAAMFGRFAGIRVRFKVTS